MWFIQCPKAVVSEASVRASLTVASVALTAMSGQNRYYSNKRKRS
jgi:hypothetical protein